MALPRTKQPLLSQLLKEHYAIQPGYDQLQAAAAQARSDAGKLARIFDQFPLTMTDRQLQGRLQALRVVCDNVRVQENSLQFGSDKGEVQRLILQWINELIECCLGLNGQLEKQLASLLNWQTPLTQHEIYLFLLSGLNVIWQTVLNAWSEAEALESDALPGARVIEQEKKDKALNAIFLYADAKQTCAWVVTALREAKRIVNEEELNKLHPTDWQQDLLRRIKKPEVAMGVGVIATIAGFILAGVMLFRHGAAPVEVPRPASKPDRSTSP